MTSYNDTGLPQNIFNLLTKTQYGNATQIDPDQFYFVDPEFQGNKVLITDQNGDIIESNIDPSDIGGNTGNVDGGRADSIYLISQVIDGGYSNPS